VICRKLFIRNELQLYHIFTTDSPSVHGARFDSYVKVPTPGNWPTGNMVDASQLQSKES